MLQNFGEGHIFYGGSLNGYLTSASHEFFASINKIFILAGGLCTGLSFYEI